MNNELADVERLLDLIGEITFGVEADLGVGRELALLARHSSSLCTRLLATDRRALPAAVDHDLATAGQAFADAEYWLSKFVMLVERAEALSCALPEGELEELTQRLSPAVEVLMRAATAAGPYLKPLNEPTAKPESPPKRGTRKLLDKYFKNMTLEKRTELLEKSQKEVLDHLEDNGLKTSDRTLRETEAWKAKQVRDWQTKNENKRELENKRFYG
jgi:hypothetical protein